MDRNLISLIVTMVYRVGNWTPYWRSSGGVERWGGGGFEHVNT